MYLSGFLCPFKIVRLSYDSLREESKEEEEGGSKFVDVPLSLKGHVIGKGGHKLHEIMETTGTTIFSHSKEEAGFTIFGDEDQTAHAERLIKGIVVKCLKTHSYSTGNSSDSTLKSLHETYHQQVYFMQHHATFNDFDCQYKSVERYFKHFRILK